MADFLAYEQAKELTERCDNPEALVRRNGEVVVNVFSSAIQPRVLGPISQRHQSWSDRLVAGRHILRTSAALLGGLTLETPLPI